MATIDSFPNIGIMCLVVALTTNFQTGEKMETTKKRSASVFTKGQVFATMSEIFTEVKNKKTVKEVREYLDETLPRFKPSSRGRQPGVKVDTTALQSLVMENASKINGNDARYFAGYVASLWNVRPESDGKALLDANTIRKLVETGKLTFPDRFVFPAKQTRQRKPTDSSVTPTEV